MPDVSLPPPGIYPDMDEATYHADPGLGSGDLKMLVEDCPAVFRHAKDNPEDSSPTRDMEIGSVAHLLALEPHKFAARVVQIEADDYRTKAAAAARASAYAEGLLPILTPDLDTALAMDKALREQIDPALLTGGHAECVLIWTDPATGQRCKARVDKLRDDIGLLLDVKTTTDPSMDAFRRRIADNGHHIQASHYINGAACLSPRRWSWLWLVQSTKAPYLACLYEPSPAWLHFGAELARAALDTHKACTEAGDWPGYADGVQIIEPPGWMAFQFEELQQAGLVRRPERRGKPALTKAQSALSVDIHRPL